MDLNDDALRSIVAHYAHLRATCGEVLADPDLVEPNGEYFPDDFSLDPEGIDRLLRRMLTYAPLSADLEVALAFVEPEQTSGGGCGSGACSPGEGGTMKLQRGGAVETETGYGVVVNVADVGDPTILTAVLARAIGRIVLFEAGEEVDARDEGVLSELTAAACGLGLLVLNGACVYKKGCGGMKRHQATFLDVEEASVALSLFCRVTDKKSGTAKRHLEVTQREAFDEALAWVDARPKMLRALGDAPETLEDGPLPIEEKKGLLSRLLSRKEETPPAIAPRPRARSEEEQRRIAEARALVDEALGE